MTVLQSPEAMIVICTVILIAYTAHVLDKAFASSEQFKAGYRDGSINYELEHCPACKNVADLQEALAENAKLRELCAGLLTGYECGYGELCKGCTWDGLGDPKTFSCLPRVKARDLGVEVSE